MRGRRHRDLLLKTVGRSLLRSLTYRSQSPRPDTGAQSLTILNPLKLALQRLNPLFLMVNQRFQSPKDCMEIWVRCIVSIQPRTEDIHLRQRISLTNKVPRRKNSPSPQHSQPSPRPSLSMPLTTSWPASPRYERGRALNGQTVPPPSDTPEPGPS